MKTSRLMRERTLSYALLAAATAAIVLADILSLADIPFIPFRYALNCFGVVTIIGVTGWNVVRISWSPRTRWCLGTAVLFAIALKLAELSVVETFVRGLLDLGPINFERGVESPLRAIVVSALLAMFLSALFATGEARRKLAVSESRFRHLFDANIVGVAFIRSDCIVQDANDVFLNVVGYSRKELASSNIRLNVTGAQNSTDESPDCISTEATDSLLTETEVTHKNGHRVPILVGHSEPTTDSEDTVAFVIDLSREKRSEKEKATLQTHLRHAQKMDAIGQLAAGVAHEFNNLLVGIRGNADLLLNISEDVIPEKYRQPLKDIERSGANASTLTKKLLSFARRKGPNIGVFDVNHVVTESEAMLEQLLSANITLKHQLHGEPALVNADEAEVEQAVINLVVNACDAMPDGGTIEIQTQIVTPDNKLRPPDYAAVPYIQLSVVDNGHGMSPETTERIFEPFFTTKPVGAGTGLGLSTVYSDMAKNGGFITVESEEGKGTTFSLYFPQSQNSLSHVMTGKNRPASKLEGGTETLLVCDDQELVLASVSSVLKNLGYTVITANSGDEALRAANAQPNNISLVLTDITMPGMNGLELGGEITRQHPHIKVIYMSGYATNLSEMHAGDDEFEFVEKGGPTSEITQRIRRVLDKEATPNERKTQLSS